jgi:peptidoglycan/xylan/chitin deacetylase (PgdA/CDA1 family)
MNDGVEKPAALARYGRETLKTREPRMKSAIIRTGFDTLYFSGAHLVMRPFFEGVGAVVMLHHVRPQRPGDFQPNRLLEVSPQFLEQTLAWLRRRNIDIISLDEMHRRMTERDFGRHFICITFDDGYRDNKVHAYPILKKYGAPFAIYVPASFPERRGKLWWLALEAVIARNDSIVVALDGAERTIACATTRQKGEAYDTVYWWLRGLRTEAEIHAFIDALSVRYGIDVRPTADELCMTWDEIREFAADPLVTIGAHTVNHVMLGKATEAEARFELKASREAVEAALGREVRHLAYPYGGRDLVGPREFRLASELGYHTAVTTRPGVLFAEHDRHLMALPRLSLNGEYQAARYVKVLMSGAATALFNGFRRVDAA